MKGKRGVPTTSGKTAVFEKLIKYRGPLKDMQNRHPHSSRYRPAADSGSPLLSATKKRQSDSEYVQ
jgi:hypothetical protein